MDMKDGGQRLDWPDSNNYLFCAFPPRLSLSEVEIDRKLVFGNAE